MPTATDRYGLPLSTSSPAAAAAYVEAIDLTLSANVGADERLAAAIEADEGFALAHAGLARAQQYRGRIPEARASAARARELAAGATRREQQHVEVIATAVDGNSSRALALACEHLRDFPRDAFVLSQANGPFGLIGFGGGPDWRQEMFALLDPLAPAYGDDWWFLSAHAFAHNELYHFQEARRLGERSLALYPRSGHGSHTLAHVFFETGDEQGGGAFLDAWLEGYDRAAQLHGHLWWHRALFALAAGQCDRALEVYDAHLRPGVNEGVAIIALADCSALLWRCGLYGESEEPLPWLEVRDFAATSFPRAGVTFADTHAALAFAAAGDGEALARLSGELASRLADGRLPAGEVVVALVDALASFANGDYAAACDRLQPFAAQVVRVGGSNAQRQVFEDTLLEAYLRAGRFPQAETMLRARLQRRPSARDQAWLTRATAGAAAGQAEQTYARMSRA
ncbi:MAG: tetratricopeptide repeat protein [Tepidiformaceae bacterium]